MKRRDVLKALQAAGLTLVEGGRHTKAYRDGRLVTTIPRHGEIKEVTLRSIERLSGVAVSKRRGG